MPAVTCNWTFQPAGVKFDYTNDPVKQGAVFNGQPMIYFQMNGIYITANVTVTNLDSVADPSFLDKAKLVLPNPVKGKVKQGHQWQIGLVQILEDSKMEVVYRPNTNTWLGRARKKTTQYWYQKVLPCYDTSTNLIPWYDVNTGLNTFDTNTAIPHAFQLTINDFPQLNATPFLHRPGHPNHGQPLLRAVKKNKFSVYLFMRELNAAGDKTLHRWILKKGTWSTKLDCEANANWAAGNNKYTAAGYTVKDPP
jgi:hypothetical protein